MAVGKAAQPARSASGAVGSHLRTLLLCAKSFDGRKKVINLDANDIRQLVDKWHADKPAIVGSDRAHPDSTHRKV